MDYKGLYNLTKEWLSKHKEHSLYNTHMFQHQSVGTAIGVGVGILAEFYLPGAGKLVGMLATPITFYSARKLALKNWHKIVVIEINEGNYLYHLEHLTMLHDRKKKMILESGLSPNRKKIELEKVYIEFSKEYEEITRRYSPTSFSFSSINNQSLEQSPIQKMLEDKNGTNNIENAPKTRKYVRKTTKP